MTRTAKALGLGVAGAAAVGGALMYTGQGGPGSNQQYDVRIQATPREIDEGELVEFVADEAPGAVYRWDFGDRSRAPSGTEVREVTHVFTNGGNPRTEYNVTLKVGATEVGTMVGVRNLPPTIRTLWRSRPALAGNPVEFDATATDPGRDDRLEYTWDFGDGNGARGGRVSHTYEKNGHYGVTVSVEDGDGGRDQQSMSVMVGDGFEFTVGGAGTGTQRGWIWVRRRNPAPIPTSSLCHLEIEFEPDAEGLARMQAMPAMGLSIAAEGGLRVGTYPVVGRHWSSGTLASPVEQRDQHPDMFFAGVFAALSDPLPTVGMYPSAGHFTAMDGRVEIEYIDDRRIEGRFTLGPMWGLIPVDPFNREDLEERHATVTGSFAGTFAPSESRAIRISAPWQVYNCKPDVETFDIESVTPDRNAVNVTYENPDIQITFNRPIDPATVANNVRLDYRKPDGDTPHQVVGAWEVVPGDANSVRFVPQGHLLDGVIYCVRVKAGKEGIRGRNREVLEPVPNPEFTAQSRVACIGQPWAGRSHDWSLTTQVRFSSLSVALYQASRVDPDVPLAPDKPTVARVYAYWEQKPDVNEFAQVKELPARVSVLVDGNRVYAPKRTNVQRADRYPFPSETSRHARNTVNFFNWRPKDDRPVITIQPVVEFIDDSGATVGTFEGRADEVRLWDRKEVLSFDYYYVNVGRWADGITDDDRDVTVRLAYEGAAFTTQNFPVLETRPRSVGDLPFDPPGPQGPCTGTGERHPRYDCYFPGTDQEENVFRPVARALYETGRDSFADIIVGVVPNGWPRGWIGYMAPFATPGKRIVLLEAGAINAVGVAHEFGHFFDLRHCPGPTHAGQPPPPPCPHRIQGFRIEPSGRAGLNKHNVEGNQEIEELFPLMHGNVHPVPATFIRARDYQALFGNIARTPRRQQQAASLPTAPGPLAVLARLISPVVLMAQGPETAGRLLVNGTAGDAGVSLDHVEHRAHESPPDPADRTGTFTLDMFDSGGRVLASVPFDVTGPDTAHGLEGSAPMFSLDLPAPAGLHTVRVTGPDGTTAERTRRGQPPTITAAVDDAGSGGRTLRWSAQDADGDAVRVSIYLRADGTGPWRGIGSSLSRTELGLDRNHLPPGQQVSARLVAFDGFNTATTEVELGPGSPVTVLSVNPVDGATGVSLTGDVSAWVSNPMPVGSDARVVALGTGSLRLMDPDGNAVFADLIYQPGIGLVTLTPNVPLRPGTRYTATIEGLEDRWGNRLERPISWSFVTAAARAGGAPR